MSKQIARRAARGVAAIGRTLSLERLRRSNALQASIWSTGGYAVSTVLRFVSRLLLAKLLTGSAPMGDLALVLAVLGGLEMISDMGVNLNVIQHSKGADPRFLGTAFSVQALRGAALWLIASALAWPLTQAYNDPDLLGLLVFGATSALLRGFVNPSLWLLNRKVDLRLPTLLTVGSEVVGFVVTVGWTMASPSAWAIIGGGVAASAMYAASSHVVTTRTAFHWDKRIAREIVRFGGWLMLSSATYFVSSRGETFILKGALPDAQFGTLAFATMLVSTPTAAFTQLSAQVVFPKLSSALREGAAAAAHQYRRAKWLFTGFGLCFAWGGMILGPALVALMAFGSTFEGLAWMVQILGLRAAFEVYGATTVTTLVACGATRFASFANIVRLVLLIGGLVVALPLWGLPGALFVLIVTPMIAYIPIIVGLRQYIPGLLRFEAATSVVFLAGSAAACVSGAVLWRWHL